MSEYVYAGLTSQSLDVFLQDSSSTTGAGLAGLVFNSAGLVASYRKGATGSRVAITLATQTVGGAYSSGGFVEIEATHMKGVYRLDLPNAAVDTEGFVTLYLYGATNLLPTALRIDCRALPVDVKKIATQTATAAAGVTFPSSIASPTNITAATGIVLSAVTHTGAVIPTVTTVTNGLDAAGVRTAIGLTVANLDTQLADLPTVAEFEARSLPAASYFVVGDYTQPPSASTISSQVAADLAVAHGVGAWTTATGFSTLSQADIRTAVGLTTANLDTQISNIQSDTNDIQARLPAALESGRIAAALDSAAIAAVADAVLTESILDHRNVAHSLAKYIWQIRQANLTIDGTVSNAITPTTLTFSSNVAATTSAYAHAVLLFTTGPLAGENSPIISYDSTNGVFLLEEPLTAAPSNGDEFVVIAGSHVHAVADIQSGLATSAALATESGKITNIENASGYLLAVLAGACADPQTASETYAITVFGSTFTVDMAGQTSTGTRTAPTLTKT